MIFTQIFGIKMQENVQWFRKFQMTCNARKALQMALYARRLETEIVKYAVEAQQKIAE